MYNTRPKETLHTFYMKSKKPFSIVEQQAIYPINGQLWGGTGTICLKLVSINFVLTTTNKNERIE